MYKLLYKRRKYIVVQLLDITVNKKAKHLTKNLSTWTVVFESTTEVWCRQPPHENASCPWLLTNGTLALVACMEPFVEACRVEPGWRTASKGNWRGWLVSVSICVLVLVIFSLSSTSVSRGTLDVEWWKNTDIRTALLSLNSVWWTKLVCRTKVYRNYDDFSFTKKSLSQKSTLAMTYGTFIGMTPMKIPSALESHGAKWVTDRRGMIQVHLVNAYELLLCEETLCTRDSGSSDSAGITELIEDDEEQRGSHRFLHVLQDSCGRAISRGCRMP